LQGLHLVVFVEALLTDAEAWNRAVLSQKVRGPLLVIVNVDG
jgi:hypothetical protein